MSIVDIELVKKIAIGAAQKILTVYTSDDFSVKNKKDNSPLTLADQLSHKYIIEELAKNYPDIPAVSEESKDFCYETRKHYQKFWLIDPLDGTKEFIKKNGEFTVNIALIENRQPVLGVVQIPVSGEIYWAQKGQGAYKHSKENGLQQLQCQEFRMTDENLGVVCSRSHLNDETKRFISELNNVQTLAIGSSLKFMRLAEGKAHIYPRLYPIMEWDIAASDIILREAGGQTIHFSQNKEMEYNSEKMKICAFIAYAKKL
ncbi:3'(2'),5'-bisphosphate nucleotidase CysQ [Candidatus Uabimicrobium sp. HlEnr_7]|uniref:3'(2'),5'-bisphosphate nucleotidase CysQ n=1 Tax=Candidatus Uabimicrobium helgolandensis TaxID=3095367 RepID=UPI0035573DC2